MAETFTYHKHVDSIVALFSIPHLLHFYFIFCFLICRFRLFREERNMPQYILNAKVRNQDNDKNKEEKKTHETPTIYYILCAIVQ